MPTEEQIAEKEMVRENLTRWFGKTSTATEIDTWAREILNYGGRKDEKMDFDN